MRGRWLIAALVVALVAIALAALAARLTEDDAGDLDSWAGSVCSSVSDWRSSILALADVGGTLTAESLRERIDDAQTATEELVAELRGLGPPEVESGDALRAELERTVDELEAEYEALRAEAQGALESTSPPEFLQGLAALAPRFQALLNGAAAVLQDLESTPAVAEETRSDLREAFDDADACRELREQA